MNRISTLLRQPLMHFAAAVTLALSVLSTPTGAQDIDRDQVETIVREYILKNPEIITEALAELDRREKAAEEAARQDVLTSSADILFNSTRQVVLGNPNGSVTLVEFFDYNCGYCKRAYGDMVRLMEENPDLRVVLKEFPVLGQPSVEAAQVAIAVNAAAPDKYGAFHEALMMRRGQANRASAFEAATAAGVSEQELLAAMNTDVVGETIEEVYSLANRLGLTGTPSYVVGDEVVMGAVGYDQLSSKLADLKNCGQTSC